VATDVLGASFQYNSLNFKTLTSNQSIGIRIYGQSDFDNRHDESSAANIAVADKGDGGKHWTTSAARLHRIKPLHDCGTLSNG
jgi:hypothetical protein